jgi:CheY-like chemotaxis protein
VTALAARAEWGTSAVLLVADDDPAARAAVAAIAEDVIEGVTVLEARDGAEAIQIGLQQRPALALIDVNMPRLGGIEAALVLRNLLPELTVALQSGDRFEHEERSRGHGLMLFDKLRLDDAVHWLAGSAAAAARDRDASRLYARARASMR